MDSDVSAEQVALMKDHFQVDAKTLQVKLAEEDYTFFLKEKNFLGVVNTIEAYHSHIVAQGSAESSRITVFKRKLYEMYEVRSRSSLEH